jgi:hypothetical protein
VTKTFDNEKCTLVLYDLHKLRIRHIFLTEIRDDVAYYRYELDPTHIWDIELDGPDVAILQGWVECLI